MATEKDSEHEVIEHLLFLSYHRAGYAESQPDCKKVLDNTHVHIIPQVNIEGPASAVPGDCSGDEYDGSRFNKLVEQEVGKGRLFVAVALEEETMTGLQ